jgi:cytochrome P450
MRRIGLELIREKQQAIHEENALGGTGLKRTKDKDLLSLFIRANMDEDVPIDQKLNIEQILDQIPTFLVAGELHCSSDSGFDTTYE